MNYIIAKYKIATFIGILTIFLLANICHAKEISVKDVIKDESMKFVYDAKDDYKIDCINYDIFIDEDDYNNAEYTKLNMDREYSDTFLYKLIFKKNDKIIKNGLVFFNGKIYGTDENGQIIKDGICKYKGKYYVSQGKRGIVLEDNERLITVGEKTYYVDKNANVYTDKKLFMKDTGIEYTFNDNFEMIEKNAVFSIVEKDGNKYIENYDKYDLDFYVINGAAYLIEEDGKIKKFDYKKPTFVEFKTKSNGKEESRLRRFTGDSFYVNSCRRINLYLSNDKSGMVAFDEEGFLVKDKVWKRHDDEITLSYYLYDETGKEITGKVGVREVNGKKYFKKYEHSGEVLNSELFVVGKGKVYYADEKSELIKNKTVANIFTFDDEYKLINNYNIKNLFMIAARYPFYNNYIKYYKLVNEAS